MRSQRIALVGAFCGGVLAGGIAAALSDFGQSGTADVAASPQAIQATSLDGSGPSRESGIHDGDTAFKMKLASAAVAAVSLSKESIVPPAIAPSIAPSAAKGVADETVVEIAKATAPAIAPSIVPSPVQGFGDEPAVEIAKTAAPANVPSLAPGPAESVAGETAVETAKAAPAIAPSLASSPAESVADEPAAEVAKAAPAIAPSMAPSPAESTADETAVETVKAAAWASTRLASLPPSAASGKADWARNAVDETADEFDNTRGALASDRPAAATDDDVELAMALAYAPAEENAKPIRRRSETPDECLAAQICIDDYLWSLYEVTPKLDTDKQIERIKATVKRKGKLRTILKTIARYVPADFTWKDPVAAQRGGMSLKDYVIGGMDRSFRVKLHNALRAMEAAGFTPGITSAFRDDYRQSIASGKKAASDSSYHGGSRRGGYGHGLAADLVSLKGNTRLERYVSSKELWKWIDEHEKELGIGRPYLDRDPPHVGPTDGKEYADKRGARSRIAGSAKSHRRVVAARSKTS